MELEKQEWKAIKKALDAWEAQGNITREKAGELRRTLNLKTDNQQIAQYFFLVALSCILLAFGAIFINDKVLERLKLYFSLSNMVIAVLSATLAAIWLWYIRRKHTKPGSTTYEIYLVLGALLALIALTYTCKVIGFGDKYTGFLFAAAVLLFGLSAMFRSRFLWVAGIAGLMGWFGAFSTLFNINNRFLGMNYPVRFTVFGLLVLGAAWLQMKKALWVHTERITYVAGMIIFFTGMWGVSIFGNYSDLEQWSVVRQTQVLAYGVVFGLAAALSFYLGIKYKDEVARDFGVFFLLLNLYTRYFEFFWDSMNKGIFFIILAVSFYGVGRYIEKGRRRKQKRSNLPE
jgi:hypothetical protein